MGKIAKLFLICTLLLVGESFADLTRPLYFSCGKRTDDGVYACNIRQLESTKSTLQPQYTKWGKFLQVFQNRIEMDLGDPSAKTEYNGFEIIFESDIDLGGYQKINGVVTCRDNTFAPMNFGPLAFQPTIDGNGKTIKNFCYIAEDENASFFSSLSNSTVKDITFLNAYVKAKTVSAGNRCGTLCDASVVADTVQNVNFENVVVRGAEVYGWQTSTLAITAKATSTDLNTPAVSLSHVTIQDVTLSMTRDVIAEYSDAEYRYDLQSSSGGVVANLGGHFKMDDSLKVLNLSAPDSISKVFKDVTNKEYVGKRYVGGIAGHFSPSANDADFDLDSIEVSAALSGLWVGGLFGRVYIDTSATKDDDIMIKGTSDFKVKDSKVALNSPVYLGGNIGKKNDMNRYFGGLVGELIWWKGSVSLSNNTVDVLADWHGDRDYSNATYMGGLVGSVAGGPELTLVNVSAENDTVTADMQTSSKSIYAGGILGVASLIANDNGESGNVRISATSVTAKESNLITTTAGEINTVNASYLVGNVVSRGGNIVILRNHAEGNIYINNSSLLASGGVGAEIGLGWFYGAYIHNNTSEGNLLARVVRASTNSNLKIALGYVAGKLEGVDSDAKVFVKNNIHYGSIDMGTFNAVGFMKVAGSEVTAINWSKTYSTSLDVRYNYRNALVGDTALAADGVLNINGTGEIIVNKNTGESWNNGVIDADVMKSRLFTYVMNATQPSGSTVTWDNKPSFLPVISEKRTAYRLAISLLADDYKELSVNDLATLKDYLPVKQCEAGACSLYVYTEANENNEAVLKPGLKNIFDELEAGFMLVEKEGQTSVYNQVFTKDSTIVGLTNRAIDVEYVVRKLDGSGDYVPLDEYADNLTFVSPKVDTIRLISGKGAIPVFLLDTDGANGNAPEYELDCDYAYNPCKPGVSLSQCDENGGSFNVESTAKRMGTFEDVLKVVRKRYDGMHQNKLVLKYLPMNLSQATLPRIDVGLYGTNAKINMTAYAYDGEGELKEIDSRELGDGIVTQSVNMTSKYQFSLADRGFNVYGWNVDFWVDLEGKPVEEITQCYNEGSKTAKCAEANKYEGLSENYFDKEYKLETVLNTAFYNLNQNKPRLSKWSTKLDPNDTLSLDSMIYAMAVAIPTRAPKAVVLMGVVPDLHAIAYMVNFDVNAGDRNVFLTDEFDIADTYSRKNDERAKLPEGVLSTEACFSGWDNGQIGVMGAKHYTSLDGDLLERANPNDKGTFALYGNWVPTSLENGGCKVKTAEVVLKVVDKTGAEGDFGSVALNSSYHKQGQVLKYDFDFKHEFKDGKLEVPASAVPMTLHVTSTQTNKDYDLAQLMLKAPDGSETAIPFTTEDTSFKFKPKNGETYTLYAVFAGYIDVRLDSLRDGAYVSVSDSKAINDKKLHLVETGTTSFPKWVYTTTECVLGWSVKPDGANYDRGVIASDDLIAKLTSDKTLYAVWKNADVCVEKAGYRRLKLESEHGTVEIAEINTVNGSVKAMHAFAEDDFTMLLPQDYTHTKWVVRAVPQRGYKLDSIVIDGRIKLAQGDVLADSLTGYLPMKAYFSKGLELVESPHGDVKLARHQVVLSGVRNGNAMQLPIQWNVTQGCNAELQATLTDFLGVTVKSLVDSVAGDSSYNWDVYPLLPGTYVTHVTITSDCDDPTSYITDPFTVEPEIAVAPDTWQMVSLSDVDESAIMWDDDIAFYYWDETAEYGVAWKYQKYNKGNVVKAQQGVWYNSLEGRPLPLRRNVATGSDTLPGAHVIEWELDSGWNMVANPYGWRVKLPEALPANVRDIYKWSADSAFRPITELQPYEAVWLRSDTKMPFSVNATALFGEAVDAGVLQKAALAKATREGWTLQAVLEDTKGHSDSWNVLGVGEANERLEPPAGMGDYVNLSVVEGKKALLKSIKSADDGVYEWNLALSATTDRVGYLKFEGVKALNDIGLRVYVTVDGKTTELGAGDSLRVMLKAAGSTATVRVSASEIQTVASKLENLRFQRVPGALQVGFDVSSDLAGASYRVQLVGINGKIAATYRGKSTAGHNTLALTAPKPGLYLLRVTLGGHHAVRKVAISR